MFAPISHDQSKRATVYCDKTHHVTVVMPGNPYAYENFEVGIAVCDCAKPEPIEPEPTT